MDITLDRFFRLFEAEDKPLTRRSSRMFRHNPGRARGDRAGSRRSFMRRQELREVSRLRAPSVDGIDEEPLEIEAVVHSQDDDYDLERIQLRNSRRDLKRLAQEQHPAKRPLGRVRPLRAKAT